MFGFIAAVTAVSMMVLIVMIPYMRRLMGDVR